MGRAGAVLNIKIGAVSDNTILPFAKLPFLNKSLNGERLAEEILSALRCIWSTDEEVFKHQHQILSITSDGAMYNSTAAKCLQERGLKSLHHFICLVHGLQLVINTICDRHKTLTTFVTNVQSTMSHSMVRKSSYEQSSNQTVEKPLRDKLYHLNNTPKDEPKKEKKEKKEKKVDLDVVSWQNISEGKFE